MPGVKVLFTREEVLELFVRAIAERGWRNGMLIRLAECVQKFPSGGKAVTSVSGTVGDYFNPEWLKKLKEKEGIELAPELISPHKVYF